ncbi:MAG: hypothetical protein K9H41_05880 [Bacteroidia bacterium]|nr:hypothetical protein [Bacteroidia bacterium]
MSTETELIKNLKVNYVPSNIENMTKTDCANFLEAKRKLVASKYMTPF